MYYFILETDEGTHFGASFDGTLKEARHACKACFPHDTIVEEVDGFQVVASEITLEEL